MSTKCSSSPEWALRAECRAGDAPGGLARSQARGVDWFRHAARMRAIEAFLQHLASRRSAARTATTYATILESFATFIESDLSVPATTSQLEAFLARPRRDRRPRAVSARNQALAAVRTFATFARRDLGWTSDPTAVMSFEREPRRDPPVLSIGETRQLFITVAARSFRRDRARNLALVAVLTQTGMRVHEVVALNVEQIDNLSASVVGVHRKGGVVNDLPLNREALALVAEWIAVRAERTPTPERALFTSVRGTRLSIRSVEYLFARMRCAMGSAKKITPHTARHSFATNGIILGTDIVTIAGTLGHASLETTRKYIHLIDTERREAARKLATTIPIEVLPTGFAKSPTTTFDSLGNPRLPTAAESPVSPRSNGSCADEHFVAILEPRQSRIPPRTATNTTRTRPGARFVCASSPATCAGVDAVRERSDEKP